LPRGTFLEVANYRISALTGRKEMNILVNE
jgi:hypothetical protein